MALRPRALWPDPITTQTTALPQLRAVCPTPAPPHSAHGAAHATPPASMPWPAQWYSSINEWHRVSCAYAPCWIHPAPRHRRSASLPTHQHREPPLPPYRQRRCPTPERHCAFLLNDYTPER